MAGYAIFRSTHGPQMGFAAIGRDQLDQFLAVGEIATELKDDGTVVKPTSAKYFEQTEYGLEEHEPQKSDVAEGGVAATPPIPEAA